MFLPAFAESPWYYNYQFEHAIPYTDGMYIYCGYEKAKFVSFVATEDVGYCFSFTDTNECVYCEALTDDAETLETHLPGEIEPDGTQILAVEAKAGETVYLGFNDAYDLEFEEMFCNIYVSVERQTETRILLPGQIETIYKEAFANTDVKHVIIPDGCEIIENKAFADCDSLTLIFIPKSVYLIADDAFPGCEGFTIETVEGSYAQEFAVEQGIDVEVVED